MAMSVTFTKLFTSITESTVWCETDRTRIVWITMLAMSDSQGRVWGSVPGLANRARVPIEDCEIALNAFRGPDAYSRTKDNEGRRIEDIDGGWRLLNHAKYRAIRDEEAIKEAKRKYINARRAKERAASTVDQPSNGVDRGRANADADTEADAPSSPPSKKEKTARAPTLACPTDVAETTWRDWLALRKAKRAPASETVLREARTEAEKADMPLERFLAVWCARGSQGLEAAWLKPHERGGPSVAGLPPNRQEAIEQRNREIGEQWERRMRATMEASDAG